MQLPDGASVARSSEVTKQVEDLLKQMPAIDHVLSIVGFSLLDGASEPNNAFMVARLKPFADRKAAADSVQALIRRTVRRRLPDPGGQYTAVQSAADHRAFDQRRFRVPARGAGGTGAGRDRQRHQRADRRRQPRSATRARVLDLHRDQPVGLSRHRPRQGAGARSQHQRRVHRAASDARRHLRHNFNLYGRTWQVNVQGEASDRGDISDIWQIYVRNSTGDMVPMRSVASLKIVTGPQVITRYNNYRSVTVNGSPAAGVSSGTALAAMASISSTTLPAGYTYEWTGTAYQEHEASGQTGIILGLAVLFAYLFLVGLYESWTIPIPVLLSVVVGVLGSYLGIKIAGPQSRSLRPDRARRADRAGRQERHSDRRIRQERREAGASIDEAAILGAQTRFRAVMMTSIAFILGLLPLSSLPVQRNSAGAPSARRYSAACWPRVRSGSSWCRCSMSRSSNCASA